MVIGMCRLLFVICVVIWLSVFGVVLWLLIVLMCSLGLCVVIVVMCLVFILRDRVV